MKPCYHIVQIYKKLLNFSGHLVDESAVLDFVSSLVLVEEL